MIRSRVVGTWSRAVLVAVVAMVASGCGARTGPHFPGDVEMIDAQDATVLCAPGERRSCYSGPAATEGVGLCTAGSQICVGGLDAAPRWSECVGEVLPSTNLCDGVDRACDRMPSAGCTCRPGEMRPCYSGPPGTDGIGTCRAGTQSCMTSGGMSVWGMCTGEVTPSPDPCDGIDHLCIGRPNPACVCAPGEMRRCYDGAPGTENVGVCRAGTQRCEVADGGSGTAWGTCSGQRVPGPPQCDGLDHACNGILPPCLVMVRCPAPVTTRIGVGVTLSATATAEPPATIVSRRWSVSDSPAGSTFAFTTTTASPTIFSANATGDYTVDFTAMDSMGRSAMCSVVVTVTPSYLGTEFWSVSTANSQLTIGDTFHFAIAIGNPNDRPTTVTVTGGSLASPLIFEVPANSAATRILPWVTALVQNSMRRQGCPAGCCDTSCCTGSADSQSAVSALVRNGAYHIQSSQPVSAYQFNPLEFTVGTACPTNSYTNDASLLLPAGALTGNYLVLAHNAWATMGSYATIVATSATPTTVRVTLSTDITAGTGVASARSGTTQTYVLNRGDVVQLVSTHGAAGDRRFLPQDMTGTVISASAPVAVVAGVDCTFMSPDGTVYACDHLEQQLFPIETWSNDVIVSQLQDRGPTERFMVRIMSRENGNTVRFVPASVHAPVTLDRGRYVEFESAADFEVLSAQPIMVAQYMEGQFTTPGAMMGDPAMVLEVPTAQYRRDYSFVVPESYTASFINVVGRSGSSILLDGVALTGTPATIAGTTWAVWRQPIVPGAHRIFTMEPIPFGLKVLGVAMRTSYAYPGGLDLGVMP